MIDILTVIGGIALIVILIILEFLLIFYIDIKKELNKDKNNISVYVYSNKNLQIRTRKDNLTIEKALQLKKFYEMEENSIVVLSITAKRKVNLEEKKENV